MFPNYSDNTIGLYYTAKKSLKTQVNVFRIGILSFFCSKTCNNNYEQHLILSKKIIVAVNLQQSCQLSQFLESNEFSSN